jgi:transposase
MARVAAYLRVSELQRHDRAAKEATAVRHYQAIWLLAKGHTVPQVARLTSLGTRWLEPLLSRYNARGPDALGDQRRHNGRTPSILKPAPLQRLKPRLATPPADGGLWTGPKVAAWMAGQLGLEQVAPQRRWEALRAIGWTIQVPRPQHPQAATAKDR